jgi:hypothetical protein
LGSSAAQRIANRTSSVPVRGFGLARDAVQVRSGAGGSKPAAW